MKSKVKTQEQEDAIKEAARILGRMGGSAGKGDAKRRSPEVYKALQNKRWEAFRLEQQRQAKKLT